MITYVDLICKVEGISPVSDISWHVWGCPLIKQSIWTLRSLPLNIYY